MFRKLLNKIDHYLIEQSSLEELQTWLLSNLQDILDSSDKAAIDVANQVDADLVEFHEGLIDEITLRERLESYIRLGETVPVVFPEMECPITVHTSVTDETFKGQWKEPTQVEDLHSDVVFC